MNLLLQEEKVKMTRRPGRRDRVHNVGSVKNWATLPKTVGKVS